VNFKEWLLSESMDVIVKNYDYPKIKDLLSLSYAIDRELYKHIPEYKQSKHMYTLTIDGTNPSTTKGTLNFYTKGIPEESIPKILKGIQYYLEEYKITYGPFRKELSKAYGTPVIRIPIKNIPIKKEGPPKLNLANANAHYLFSNILGFHGENGYNIPARDLLIKIDTIGYVKSRPQQIYQQPGKATTIEAGYSKEMIEDRLEQIRKIAQWAIENGYDYISVF